MTDVYGNINWWGFSPALDLQQTGLEEMAKKVVCSVPDELNILLVGSGDLRHILKTVAHRYRHTKRKIKFYIVESALELYLRDIMLMMVALEKPQNMGLQEKTQLFLEMYGNTLIRQQASQYIEKMAHQMIQMVTDFDYLSKKLSLFDLSQLKYKERDFLEGVLKYWRNRDKATFEVVKCWDIRLRQHLGVRYDSRMNAFDWDYNMALMERGGSIVHMKQYKGWRSDGIAYTIRDGTYDVPNRMLSSATVFRHEGERHPRRGYWGDMVVSPYITFGIETEEKSFYQKRNNMHMKTAEDVAEFNITALFHEIINGEKYILPEPEKVEEKAAASSDSASLTEIKEEDDEKEAEGDAPSEEMVEKLIIKDENNAASEDIKVPFDSPDYEWLQLEDVKVVFLSIGSLPELCKKRKFHKMFNVAFFSNSMVHHLKKEVTEMFADKCSVILETALFMLHIKKEQMAEFVKKVSGMAKEAGCQPLETCDELQDSYATFYFER